MQTRPQRRTFMCPTFSGRPKESDVSMERNPVSVSMLVLWPCTSPICFHKTPKDPHDPFKKDRGTHSNLFGRYLDHGQDKRRDYSSTRYTHSFTSVPGGFVINQKKPVMTSVQEIEFLGVIVNSKEMTISLPQKKLQPTKQMCQDLYQNPETTGLALTKVLGHLTSTILAILPAKLLCRFLQQRQIQALKKNGSYESQVLLNKESQLELLWWVKNIEIYNGRTLINFQLKLFCRQMLRSQIGGQPRKE